MRYALLAASVLFMTSGPASAQPAGLEGDLSASGVVPACCCVCGCDPWACGPPVPALWFTAEYLLWWVSDGPMPVPVLTSAPATSPAAFPAALGNPDTTIVFGGRAFDFPVHSGARFALGLGLDPAQTLALEGSYFFLGEESQGQQAASDGSPTSTFLANPFVEGAPGAFSGVEIANYLAFPPFLGIAGGAVLTATSRFQGAECNAVANLAPAGNARLSLLAGFRFLKLDEGVVLDTIQTDPDAASFPGQFVRTIDDFSTRNNFYGGQLGGRLNCSSGPYFLTATAKVALGSTHEVVRVLGVTNTNSGPDFLVPIPVTTVPGGIYAQPTNIGLQSRNRFAVAPEATVQVGAWLTDFLGVFVGYNFLYLSDVVRPGDQIDRTINSTQLVSFTGVPTGPLVGPARPAPLFNRSDFWAQGVNFGCGLFW